MSLSVAVVTPWRDHPELADGYWQAVEAGAPDEVIIVDDGSAQPPAGTVVTLEEPRGFCAACNAGLAAVQSDAVVFLNNDVELVAANWLREIRRRLGRYTLVGELRAGPHTLVDGVEHPYIDGWCIAAIADDFRELGGWDESLAEPAYYCDNLLSHQAEWEGWRFETLTVGLRHLVSATTKGMPDAVQSAAVTNRAVWEQAVRGVVPATT